MPQTHSTEDHPILWIWAPQSNLPAMNGSAENFQIEAEAESYLTSGWSILNTGKSQAPWNHDCFHHSLRTCWLPAG